MMFLNLNSLNLNMWIINHPLNTEKAGIVKFIVVYWDGYVLSIKKIIELKKKASDVIAINIHKFLSRYYNRTLPAFLV